MKQFLFIIMLPLIAFIDIDAQEEKEMVSDSLSIDTITIGSTKEFASVDTRKGKIFWDAYLRLRHEYWDNQEDLNDDLDDLYSFFRLKLHLGGGFRPSKNTKIYARIINEGRYYGHKGTGDSTKNAERYDPQRHYFEVVLGQLFFTWKNIGKKPLSIKIGRQNLHDQGFGDQWLIGDGTPQDGSKTFYFNAARLTYIFNKTTSLDMVGLVSFKDDPLVLYSESDKTITNITNEQGAFVWFKHNISAEFPYRTYYLYKHENGGAEFHRKEESNIHTLGLHVKPENQHLWLNGQIALQMGTYGQVQRSGLGFIVYGGYKYEHKKFSIKTGPWYLYLSGDDPGTKKIEAFNNLYGGYPNDDELYLNTLMNESGTSMYTNMNLLGAYFEITQPAKYNIRFWYHYMAANELVNGSFFGKGKLRGHMWMLKSMFEIGKKLKAYYMFEYLLPGDFHFNGADNSILSRINLEWYF